MQVHKYKIIMTTYMKHLFDVTGSSQGADGSIIRAIIVMY